MTQQEKVKLYFERIGLTYTEGLQPNGALLKELQFAHVTHVPYETTEIVDRHPLSLEEDDLFQKVVVERRGGYCFELNGLFAWLLRSLGYRVNEYFGRFLKGEPEPPKPRHRVLEVTAPEGKYLCDVGVGCRAPREPLLITEGVEQPQYGECYKFGRDDFLGWILYEQENGVWSPLFCFNESRMLAKDFYTPSFYCENHPDSPFLRNMLSLKTAEGRVTLDNNTFRIWKNGVVVEECEMSDDALEATVQQYFGMSLHREKREGAV